MRRIPRLNLDSQMEQALSELRATIMEHYPTATFSMSHGDDPEGVYLIATVDVEDTDAVVDVFIARLLEMQIEQGLPLYVVPIRPTEHVPKGRRQLARTGAGSLLPPLSQ